MKDKLLVGGEVSGAAYGHILRVTCFIYICINPGTQVVKEHVWQFLLSGISVHHQCLVPRMQLRL